jgi:hypothetical protein
VKNGWAKRSGVLVAALVDGFLPAEGAGVFARDFLTEDLRTEVNAAAFFVRACLAVGVEVLAAGFLAADLDLATFFISVSFG